MNHTHGPWTYTEDLPDDTRVKCLTIRAPSGHLIGHINSNQHPFGDAPAVGAEETVANAALVVAAPDLLAVLEKCCATMEANDADYYAGDIRAARAAIAKARGQS